MSAVPSGAPAAASSRSSAFVEGVSSSTRRRSAAQAGPRYFCTPAALWLRNFADIAAVQHAFAGIRVAVCVLVLFSVAKLFKSGVKNALGLVVFAAACLVTIVFGVSPVILVAAAIALGIVLGLVRKGGDAA